MGPYIALLVEYASLLASLTDIEDVVSMKEGYTNLSFLSITIEFFGIFIPLPTSIIFPSLKINVPFLIVFSELTTIVALTNAFYGSFTTFTPEFVGKYSFCDNTKNGISMIIAAKNLLKAPIVFILNCLFFNKYKLLL